MDNFDPDKDLRRTREVDFGDNNKLLVKCTDPYGFWSIHYQKGEVPQALQGTYTTFDEAMKAIKTYLLNTPSPAKKKEIKQVIS
jgi:hypothetical protein